ncbi:exodeoxyribonuclease V subunit gamma [Neptunicella marina]|uniref:RecBCD enzyme subunit RecC n=1 Tax=Neptunicella marina TaxID=2125989 RepID=A0A8J6IUI9_9ALTE|nr:exodeoxyribonuclease V subunit gamma [Neptunicella marina]MBC3766172.1 exodeoxyribonuclease V subunit gamma [Neptunicella marina]
MLTVYPSNKLELHVDVLLALAKNVRQSPLAPVTILVENKAMQHWLQMEMAKRAGIAMQFEFKMPSAFIWQIARKLMPDVPTESTFGREVLRWRIDELFQDEAFLQQPLFAEAGLQTLWQKGGSQAEMLRFQMASDLADLFEQYLMFRPLELTEWSQQSPSSWQALVWKTLVEQDSQTPLKVQQTLLEILQNSDLPDNLIMFGINHMPPQTLGLFKQLAERINIHLFHLNPCFEYWGDVVTDKIRVRRQLVAEQQGEASNPLLANLGQQGKDFFNRLLEGGHNEISIADDHIQPGDAPNVLKQIQQDILELRDARKNAQIQLDQSIHLVSCHSALREVQVLHDWLLHQFNQDASLQPRDVLILCPGVEDYAPYVLSVFRHPYLPDTSDSPRLPCSVADRAPLDAEPLVAAFMDLLSLPDSRFAVSKIISYLKLPAIAQRFAIDEKEVDTLCNWLVEACVHWGLDQQQVQRFLPEQDGGNNIDERFTWHWGLQRLLTGFMRADHEHLVTTANGKMHVLPIVEGSNGVLLGRLMQLLENLSLYSRQLQQPRTAEQWQSFLLSMKEQFFAPLEQSEDADEIITEVINGLHKQHQLAKSNTKLPLPIIRHALHKRFTQADNYNQFLTGAVTFSSMVPMRSIPFKLVAILGMNDGQFPRQSQPNSFDVLDLGSRAGDRSRRNDDRYLFLESLLSARDKLYLSFVGRDIKNNAERQPSLVLQELFDYLRSGYGWLQAPETETNGQLNQQALHPFSRDNFIPPEAGFDQGWLRQAEPSDDARDNLQLNQIEPLPLPDDILSINKLVRVLDNPLAFFARERLKLWLGDDENELQDSEPFTINKLDETQLKQALISDALYQQQDAPQYIEQQLLSGRIPREQFSQQNLMELQQGIGDFAEIIEPSVSGCEKCYEQIELQVNGQPVTLEAELYLNREQQKVVYWRAANRKAKDDVRMWLQLLVAIVAHNKVFSAEAWCDDAKSPLLIDPVVSVDDAKQYLISLLKYWQTLSAKPLPVYSQLASAVFNGNDNPEQTSAAELQSKWFSECLNDRVPLDRNGYFNWFYPQVPELNDELLQHFKALYAPLYRLLKRGKAARKGAK